MAEEEIIIRRTPEEQWKDYQDLAAQWNKHGESIRQIATKLGVPKTTAAQMVQLGIARAEGRTAVAGVRLSWAGLSDGEPAAHENDTPNDPFDQENLPGIPENLPEPTPGPAASGASSEDDSKPRETPVGEPSPEAAWPMSRDEMNHLAKMHKASHYEPETWPHWAKKLEFAIDPKACLDMERIFPDEENREKAVYEDIMTAIHTGRNSLWKWTGVNLSLVLPQHKLFLWCQMNSDGKTMEIKFVRPDAR